MNTWFTADLHIDHANIIRFCNRPQLRLGDLDKNGQWISKYVAKKRAEEFKRFMAKRWNERVKKNDDVIHIGDWGFGKGAFEFRKKLNGNIIFIQGNHDRNNGIKTKISKIIIKIGGEYVNLVHNPQYSEMRFRINLTGHVHNNWKIKRVKTHFGFTDCINVGVDVWDFYPITYNELMKRYAHWRKSHGKKY